MDPLKRHLKKTPSAIVKDGTFHLGLYEKPFRRLNFLDAALESSFLFSRFKKWRLKEWQHFALINSSFYLTVVIFDAKFLALGQICVYNRQTGESFCHERKILGSQLPPLPEVLWDAKATFHTKGFSIDIHNELDRKRHHISFEIAGQKNKPPLKGHFTCLEDYEKEQPIIASLPLPKKRALYTHKALTPIEGYLELGEKKETFDSTQAYGLIDIHKGYYPREMKWHWATAGGFDDDGRLMGFNLSDNQVIDKEKYNENGFWLAGQLHLLPPVKFFNVSDKKNSTWIIRDAYDQVFLQFHPEHFRRLELNYGLMKNRYLAPHGYFSGWIKDGSGQQHDIEELFGMAEDFYLKA